MHAAQAMVINQDNAPFFREFSTGNHRWNLGLFSTPTINNNATRCKCTQAYTRPCATLSHQGNIFNSQVEAVKLAHCQTNGQCELCARTQASMLCNELLNI